MDPALDDSTVTAWLRLMRGSQAVLSAVEARLKAADLPPLGWYDVLWELEQAGQTGLRPAALEDRLLLPQYGVSRLLDRISRAGLIAAGPVPGDGRGQLWRLTDAGHAMRARMWPVYAAALRDRIESRLSPSERDQLASLLSRLHP